MIRMGGCIACKPASQLQQILDSVSLATPQNRLQPVPLRGRIRCVVCALQLHPVTAEQCCQQPYSCNCREAGKTPDQHIRRQRCRCQHRSQACIERPWLALLTALAVHCMRKGPCSVHRMLEGPYTAEATISNCIPVRSTALASISPIADSTDH